MPRDEKALLRALLRELLAERPDADIFYIPHGEAGLRRLITALLAMRPDDAENPRVDALLAQLHAHNP